MKRKNYIWNNVEKEEEGDLDGGLGDVVHGTVMVGYLTLVVRWVGNLPKTIVEGAANGWQERDRTGGLEDRRRQEILNMRKKK